MFINVLKWLIVLFIAYLAGKLMAKIKMPSILGWLIVGIFLGPYALNLLPQEVISASWYKVIIAWMQCSFGIMLGTELIWSKLKKSGGALVVTTLTQSLGTFLVVSIAFGIVFHFLNVPLYLGFVFGAIAMATAPAPALSIVNEFKAKGPVTNTLLPMAILDDIIGIAVFFTVNSLVAANLSNGSIPMYMILVMIFLPIIIGVIIGYPTGLILKKCDSKKSILTTVIIGLTLTMATGKLINTYLLSSITLNYMLMGVAFSAIFSNMVDEDKLNKINSYFSPILSVSLLASIVDLGAPLDYHLIFNAGLFTAIYIIFRAIGKYFGARIGATITNMEKPVQKYLGLTLLPHSGVSLLFTGIICSTLASQPQLVQIVEGTIAAAAIINEFISVFAAKKGFQLAKEI